MAGIPKRGWGGLGLGPHILPQPIDLDAVEDAQISQRKNLEEKTKQAETLKKQSEARGPPTRMTSKGPFPFLIDSYNFKVNCSPEALDSGNSKKHWNRLTIIGGAKFPKEEVLDVIAKNCTPFMLIPVLYQTDGEDTFFLFRDMLIIHSLLDKAGQTLAIVDSAFEEPLEISFLVQYISIEDEPLNPMNALRSAVSRRTHSDNGAVTLDLRNFRNDPEFKNLYVTFRTFKLMPSIAAIVKKDPQFRRFHTLLMSHNELDRLDPIYHLFSPSKVELHTLDLRHNKLTYSGFERILGLKNWGIYHLLLEGNPIYEDYETPSETICELRKMIPLLKQLDGVNFDQVLDTHISFKFYAQNPGFASFVDHFFHHYFSFLETDKEKLVQMYDPQGFLSFSVCQNDRTPVPGSFFSPSNRNLISMSNITKTYDNAFIGKTRIHDALALMPKMKFDCYSFNIDMPHAFPNGTVLVSCTGVFSLPDEPNRQVYTFGRACVIRRDVNVGDWKITNDMWTMMNALPPFSAKCFKSPKQPVKNDFAVMLNPLTKDKDVLKKVVGDMTNMKSAWVEKYLGDSGWDLECTLLSFIDHYKSMLIPPEAFLPFNPPPAD